MKKYWYFIYYHCCRYCGSKEVVDKVRYYIWKPKLKQNRVSVKMIVCDICCLKKRSK